MTDVIAFKTTRFRCPHCGRTGSNRARMQHHADGCVFAPETSACSTCDANRHGQQGGWICTKGARPEGVRVVMNCPAWIPDTTADSEDTP